jgi:acyl-CoA reductase-like NAD-dependent aldehyde dehydrogenase
MVLKPASATPLTALLLAEVLEEEAGLPPGWLNTVTVPGSVADRLVTHPDVAAITFTGSPEVGWGIRGRAPRKRVGLELGNNAPVIIHRDADVAAAAARVAVGGYSYSGQTCISVQRIYSHEDVYEEFLAELTAAVGRLVTGDPADPATDVSSLINESETARVRAVLDEAVDGGADLLTGGSLEGSDLLAPTVLAGVRDDMAVCRTEVFGPVVGVRTYRDLDAAFDAANDTRYGLQAGIFTSDTAKVQQAWESVDVGGLIHNDVPTWRTDPMPYGGVKASGIGREGPIFAYREMTEERMLVLRR